MWDVGDEIPSFLPELPSKCLLCAGVLCCTRGDLRMENVKLSPEGGPRKRLLELLVAQCRESQRIEEEPAGLV